MLRTLPARILCLTSLWSYAVYAADARPAGGDAADFLAMIYFGLVILLLGTGFTMLCVIAQALRPESTRDISVIACHSPRRSLLYGVLISLILLLALIIGSQAGGGNGGQGALLAIILLIPFTYMLVLGTTGVVHALGEKVLTGAQSSRQCSDTWAVGIGASVLALVNLVPLIGWILFVVGALIGLGAFTRNTFAKRRPVPEAPTEA